ncbi:unnamed protein product [Leptidea sinapis]|uniref:EGF-like domain-containing protein n=1 Tax=Leptidea sinapis TaxID=189913 RepID=A0A5E4PZ68_9NEOP|nr:unnamed protein product [Leptidea sinapis]
MAEGGSIARARLDAGSLEGGLNLSDHSVLLRHAGHSLKDFFIWSRESQHAPEHSNPCAASGTGQGGGCEALCLWDGRAPRCVCPHGELAEDGTSCRPYTAFLMYSRLTKIDSIHLEDSANLNSPYPPIENKSKIGPIRQ